MSLDLAKLVQLVVDLPKIQRLPFKLPTEIKDAVTRHAADIVDQVSMAFDWEFTLGVADQAMVAAQAEYELKGNKDCRDIINVRYGSTSSWALLDKLRPVDMDAMLSDRTVTGVGWWYISGRSTNGYPKITIVATPGDVTKSIRYRYRKKDIGLGSFPEEFAPVLIAALVARFIPAHTGIYEHEIAKMVDRYAVPGGEDNPAPLAAHIITRNNRRAQKYGYSQ